MNGKKVSPNLDAVTLHAFRDGLGNVLTKKANLPYGSAYKAGLKRPISELKRVFGREAREAGRTSDAHAASEEIRQGIRRNRKVEQAGTASALATYLAGAGAAGYGTKKALKRKKKKKEAGAYSEALMKGLKSPVEAAKSLLARYKDRSLRKAGDNTQRVNASRQARHQAGQTAHMKNPPPKGSLRDYVREAEERISRNKKERLKELLGEASALGAYGAGAGTLGYGAHRAFRRKKKE